MQGRLDPHAAGAADPVVRLPRAPLAALLAATAVLAAPGPLAAEVAPTAPPPAEAPAAPLVELPPARPDEVPAADAPAPDPAGGAAEATPPVDGPAVKPAPAADPPPLPASLVGVPEPVLALHVSTTFCEDPSGPPLAGHDALVAPLGRTAVLVGIPCTGDAGRAAFRLYVHETGEIGGVHAQFFALPSKTLGWTGTEVLWSPKVDREGRLTGTLYDPGEGRCTSRGRWRWTGYALAMETAEMEASCGAGDWRTIYP